TCQFLSSFSLINADTDKPIQTLSNGATLFLVSRPTGNLNLRSFPTRRSSDIVVFALTGAQARNQTETTPPYALFGDNSGNYNPWTPVVGSYTLKGTPFSGSGVSGTAGSALTISFTVIDQASTPTPTPTPTSTP